MANREKPRLPKGKQYIMTDMAKMEMPQLPKGQLFINGEWRNSKDGKTGVTINPSTEEEIMCYAKATPEDVNDAVYAASEAYKNGEWKNMGPHDRSRLLNKMADALEDNADQLSALESIDAGKPIQATRTVDFELTADILRFAASIADSQMDGHARTVTPPVSGTMPFAYTRREPLGVVAAITPFNFPMVLSMTKIAPALAAGNTFIHKPGSATPLTALKFAEIFEEVGLPKGVYNVITGAGGVVGNALVEHPKVQKIAFTGSTPVGKGLMRAGSDTLKKFSLELGGKNAELVFESANLDTAIPHIINGAFFNKGEFCMSISRLLVQRSIYDEVVKRLVEAVKMLTLGDLLDWGTTYGPQIDATARDKCAKYTAIAVKDGASIATGGKPTTINGKGFYFEPTLLVDVKNHDQVAQEEIFGPVLSIIPFDTEADAIAMANDSPFGLSSGLQTQNLAQAHRVAHQLEAGMVWVNTWGVFDSKMPFGGYKQSGMGREIGLESYEHYTQHKSIYMDLNS